MSLDDATLRALARKYAALEALAREPEATEPGPYAERRRRAKRLLAEEFPGCLRELDCFHADELTRRARVVGELLGGHEAARPAWVELIADFHLVTRRLLELKRRGSPPSPADLELLRAYAPLPDLARLVARPPGGRLLGLTYTLLGARHGLSTAQIRELLFPRTGG